MATYSQEDERILEIMAELKSMPKAPAGDIGAAFKWKLYIELRKIRMKIAKSKGDHTPKQFGEAFPVMICGICGSDDRPSKDHITPISKGGSNGLNNIQILCVKCNARKGGRLA